VADHLNLPGLPIRAAEACTDKELMRQMFAAAPEPISPDFKVIDSENSLIEFANSHSFPLILKPANLVKSLLVTRSDSLDELLANYHSAMSQVDDIYRKYAPNRKPKLLVEEFLEGSIHSVDAFVDAEGTPHVLENVVDYLTGYDIGYNDNFHYARLLPSKLDQKTQEAIRHTASLGCRALGMKSSPAHIEIILTPKGPRIVEIGARNGGYRERMHRLANDIDIPRIAFDVALGKQPDITSGANRPTAVLELFPKTPGIFTGISHENELRKLPSLKYFALKQTIGEKVGSSSDGYKMCAIIILHSADTAQFEADLAFVTDSVEVTTRH
jgi:biotin carboxylase